MTSPNELLRQVAGGEVDLGPTGPGDVELLFTGDLHPGGRTEALLLRGDHDAAFGDALPLLRGADLSVTNLEAPLTGRGAPIPKTGPCFRADPGCAAGLRDAGFDVVSLANNHILDYGAAGLADTIEACRGAGLEAVGAGEDLQAAQAPLVLERGACRVAILSFAEGEFSASRGGPGACPLDPVANHHQILEARRRADLVFVTVHGGHEFHPLPSPRMVQTCRFFAELGVAAVVGHHPHVASGMELHHGVPILYSLGTLLFDPPGAEPEDFHRGLLARFRISSGGVRSLSLHPCWQYREGPGLRLMAGEARARFLAAIAERSRVIQDPKALAASWAELCEARREAYLSLLLRRRGLRRLLPGHGAGGREHLRVLLNLFRCQAHHEACVGVLERAVGTDERET